MRDIMSMAVPNRADLPSVLIVNHTLQPVAWVQSPRVRPLHDYWRDLESIIELDRRFGSDALLGLEGYSHLEVVFQMHEVAAESVVMGTRRPRRREAYPEVGIFAQRDQRRPNRLGVSRCRLVRVDGRRLVVRDLDAIDGSPVIDIKPYMIETAPIGEVSQPEWTRALMADYDRSTVDDPRRSDGSHRQRIELVYDDACPNVDAARHHLASALEGLGLTPRWREYHIGVDDLPSHAEGHGSPTVLVGGRCVAGAPAHADHSCRIYTGVDGVLTGAPPADVIARAIQEARGTGGRPLIEGADDS
jgi:tRNA-Thr(GGU) m(6)t(6)A37 methyltransferase TsaA